MRLPTACHTPLKKKSGDLNQSHLSIDHVRTDVLRKSVHGGAQTLIAQLLRVGVQTSSMCVFARLLSPEDYGAFGIVLSVTAFASIFREMGLSTATVQTDALDHKQLSTLFWVAVAQSVLLALLTVALAPLVATLFKDERLFPLLAAMSSTYVLWAIGSQHMSVLRRQMKYDMISYIEVSSLTLGVLVGLAAAASGAQIWSLVYAQIAIASFWSIGCWIACKWRPGLPVRGSGVAMLLRVGQHMTASNLLTYLNSNLDNFLIGKWCGTSVLGLYDRAYLLYTFPSQQVCAPVASVAVGALSRLRHDAERFNAYASKTVFLAAAMSMPAATFLLVKADSVVALTLGTKWLGASCLLKALALAAFADPLLIALGWICVASEQTSRMLRARVAQSVLTVIAFLIGIKWGALGVAVSVSATRLIVVLPTYAYCLKHTSTKMSELLRSSIPAAIASLAAGLFVSVVHCETNQLIDLALSGLLFALIHLGVLSMFPSARRILSTVFATLRPAVLKPNTSKIYESEKRFQHTPINKTSSESFAIYEQASR